jgi:putative ABC transport system permease protein
MVFGILMLMVLVSSWIALGSVKENRLILYKYAFISIALGGGLVFVIITQGVLQMDKWYSPLYTIPIAGMVFANSMNCVSLAAERIHAEMSRGVEYLDARRIALQTSLIPITNSLFAVGVVSLPGMMTGQILSGVSPLIAARYQIMVMCMIFAASGISTIMFLTMGRTIFVAKSSSDASN